MGKNKKKKLICATTPGLTLGFHLMLPQPTMIAAFNTLLTSLVNGISMETWPSKAASSPLLATPTPGETLVLSQEKKSLLPAKPNLDQRTPSPPTTSRTGAPRPSHEH